MKKILAIFLALFVINNLSADKDRWDDDKSNWSELMLAIYYKNNTKVRQLIHNNIDVLYNAGGTLDLTAMDIAIYQENDIALSELLKTGKIINKNKYLNLACNFNNKQIIKYLCDFGADINYIDERGYNSIMYATSFSTIEIMNFLIEQNVDVNLGRRPGDGATALILAIYSSNIEKIEILLKAGADKNIKNNAGETIYDIAAKYLNRNQLGMFLRLVE
jgi:ankyrin repeat protein